MSESGVKRVRGYHWATATGDRAQRFGQRQIVYRTGCTEEFFQLEILDVDCECSERGWRDFSSRLEPPAAEAAGAPAPSSPGWWWVVHGASRRGWMPVFVEFENDELRRIRVIGSDDWISVDPGDRWVPVPIEVAT